MATNPNTIATPSQVHPTVKPENTPRYTAEEIIAKRAAAQTAAERTFWANELVKLDAHDAAQEIKQAEVSLIEAFREVLTAFSKEARALLSTQQSRMLMENGQPAVLMTRDDGWQLVSTLAWRKPVVAAKPAAKPATPAKESAKG